MTEQGVVVVGLGLAGKVRVRDLQEKTTPLTLKGYVSRREVDIGEVPKFSLEESLKDESVKAIIISTEPALHENYARQALENGKHVLVEYPAALTTQSARQLYQLAEEKGLVLCEENIALLTEGILAALEKAKTLKLKQATYSLSGSFNGWLEKFDSSGLPFVTGVSGLQVMLSLFGDLKVKGGKMERSDDGYTAQGFFETEAGSPITITLSRTNSKEAKRTKQVVLEFDNGEVFDMSKVAQRSSKKGLFMQDMELFAGYVADGKIPANSKWLTLRSLEIAEEVHKFF